MLGRIESARKKGDTPTASTKQQAKMPPLRQLSLGVYSAVKPALSPSGKYLLYAALGSAQAKTLDLYIMPSEGGNSLRITENTHASGDMPVFSADGSYVVFSRFRNGEDGSTLPDLWRVPSFGNSLQLFIKEARGAGFSPDGQWVAYVRSRFG